MEKRDFENPNRTPDHTELPRELFEKQVFSDAAPKEEPEAMHSSSSLPQPELNQRLVLDEGYAARKRDAEAAPAPKQAARTASPTRRSSSPAAPRRTRTAGLPERLCSGETPADAARRIIREIAALLVFVLLVRIGFWGRNTVLNYLNDNDYSSVSESTTYSEPVHSGAVIFEDTATSGGYAAAQAVCTELGTPITDSSLFTKEEGDTLFPSDVAACMEGALPVGSVQLKSGMSNLDLLIQIHESLRAEKPVIVLLSEENAEDVCLQYAVVTAMDAEKDSIIAAMPDGSTGKFTLAEFIARTRFENYEDMPFQVKAGLSFGSWARNTAIFVE